MEVSPGTFCLPLATRACAHLPGPQARPSAAARTPSCWAFCAGGVVLAAWGLLGWGWGV